ncbi:hypothetical protein GGR08_000841 [Bartonella fuyuanensis]|uniref:Uncharacterized protein n=1 Tax=Bartonella fuyuanensis TaxID=1460968 RepID=A0A840DU10_9HYPH|nr:hypothetical protein [Bartonella fuyuanensis]MBB4076541.1 hypothetical protein [Bartonella fuyuanensis]
MKALDKIHYGYFYRVTLMNIKYFITVFATFASISAAQGSPFLSFQKLIQGISASAFPIDHFSREQSNKILSEVFQMEFSCRNNSKCVTTAKLVPVAYSRKKRGHRPQKGTGKRGRPNLFIRSPMSF